MSTVRKLLRGVERRARIDELGFVDLLALREELFVEVLACMLAESEDSQRIWQRSARRPS